MTRWFQVYRVSRVFRLPTEKDIMAEIRRNGPVEAGEGVCGSAPSALLVLREPNCRLPRNQLQAPCCLDQERVCTLLCSAVLCERDLLWSFGMRTRRVYAVRRNRGKRTRPR